MYMGQLARSAGLLVGTFGVVSCGETARPIGDYATLQKSEFFSFFNIHEVGREKERSGVIVHLKPGAAKNAITMTVLLDEDNNIHAGDLWLTREWVGNGVIINPLATDIGASFAGALLPSSDE